MNGSPAKPVYSPGRSACDTQDPETHSGTSDYHVRKAPAGQAVASISGLSNITSGIREMMHFCPDMYKSLVDTASATCVPVCLSPPVVQQSFSPRTVPAQQNAIRIISAQRPSCREDQQWLEKINLLSVQGLQASAEAFLEGSQLRTCSLLAGTTSTLPLVLAGLPGAPPALLHGLMQSAIYEFRRRTGLGEPVSPALLQLPEVLLKNPAFPREQIPVLKDCSCWQIKRAICSAFPQYHAAFSGDRNWKVVYSIATHPAAHPDTLERIFSRAIQGQFAVFSGECQADREIVLALAGNPALPVALQEHLLACRPPDMKVIAALANNAAASHKLLQGILNFIRPDQTEHSHIFRQLTANPRVPGEIKHHWIISHAKFCARTLREIRITLASMPVHPDIRNVLATCNDLLVLKALAGNKASSHMLLSRLARITTDREVTAALVANPNTPLHIKAVLLAGAGETVLVSLAASDATWPDMQQHLAATCKYPAVLAAIAGNSKTPPNVLLKMAHSTDIRILQKLVTNKSASSIVLKALLRTTMQVYFTGIHKRSDMACCLVQMAAVRLRTRTAEESLC